MTLPRSVDGGLLLVAVSCLIALALGLALFKSASAAILVAQ